MANKNIIATTVQAGIIGGTVALAAISVDRLNKAKAYYDEGSDLYRESLNIAEDAKALLGRAEKLADSVDDYLYDIDDFDEDDGIYDYLSEDLDDDIDYDYDPDDED